MDESTDNTDNAQLMVFVRFFDEEKGEFHEDVLGLTNLHGHTRVDDIYEAVAQMLRDREIDLKHVVSIATDGAIGIYDWEKEGINVTLESSPPCPNSIPLHNSPDGFVCQPWRKALRSHENSHETCQLSESILCSATSFVALISNRGECNI